MTMSQFIHILSYWITFLFLNFFIRDHAEINIFAPIHLHSNFLQVIYLAGELLNWRVWTSTLPGISKLLSKVIISSHMLTSSIWELLLLCNHENSWYCHNLNIACLRWYLTLIPPPKLLVGWASFHMFIIHLGYFLFEFPVNGLVNSSLWLGKNNKFLCHLYVFYRLWLFFHFVSVSLLNIRGF